MIEVFAPAKINLSLHVTGLRDDGYHLLDSLVVFADTGDRLLIEKTAQMSLQVTGPYAQGVPTNHRNLVWRAAEMCELSGEITLEKHLPNAAGIGGGSADAAAVVRAAEQYGFLPKGDIATLGADVPVCMSSKPQRMQGVGERLTQINGLPDLWMVLVNPRIDVPTPAVFSALTTKSNPAMSQAWPRWEGFEGFCSWLGTQRNDLEEPAVKLQPVIETVLDALYGARLARMSGSGATCFGLYPSAAESVKAAARIQAQHPSWWVVDTRVLVD